MAGGNHECTRFDNYAGGVQSAPGRMAGGNGKHPVVGALDRRIQFSPGGMAGGNGSRASARFVARGVSIRPRPDGRGKLYSPRAASPRPSFNPPPAGWPGETTEPAAPRAPTTRCFNPPPAGWPGETP